MMPFELQKAVYERLKAFTALTDLLADDPRFSGSVPAVYDHVPQEAVFPYVVIGDDMSVDFDTDDTTGSDTEVTVHVWSQFRGRGEVKKIQREIHNALHRHDLSVDGSVTTVTAESEEARSLVDDDGLTRHGVQDFRVLLQET